MFAQAVQFPTPGTFPTTLNLTDSSYFGPWGTPIVSSPLNSDVLRNIRSLTASDFFNYPAQNAANYVINSTLGGRGYNMGMPFVNNFGIDALNPIQTALGIAAINGGLSPFASPFGVNPVSPWNSVPGLHQVSPAINYAAQSVLPTVLNQIHSGINGLHGNPFQTAFAGNPIQTALQAALIGNPLQTPLNGNPIQTALQAALIGNPFQTAFAGNPFQTAFTGNPFQANMLNPNLSAFTNPTTAFGGGFHHPAQNLETQALLQGIYGLGQVSCIDNDSEIIFECAVPGISSSNIEVAVVQNQIRVRLIPTSGQSRSTTTTTSNGSRQGTTNVGAPIYTLPVPTFCDVNKINARVENGRLLISVPRSGEYQKNITRVKVS